MIFLAAKIILWGIGILSLGAVICTLFVLWGGGYGFRGYFKSFGKGCWINWTAAGAAFVCISSAMVMTYGKGSTDVAFTYEGASDGENPDGTRFYIEELISDSVLNKVIADEKLPLNSTELKEGLKITPVKIKGYSEGFVTSQYVLSYEPKKFSGESGQQITDAVVDSFVREFNEKYGVKSAIFTLESTDGDYGERCRYLGEKCLMAAGYISQLEYEDLAGVESELTSIERRIEELEAYAGEGFKGSGLNILQLGSEYYDALIENRLEVLKVFPEEWISGEGEFYGERQRRIRSLMSSATYSDEMSETYFENELSHIENRLFQILTEAEETLRQLEESTDEPVIVNNGNRLFDYWISVMAAVGEGVLATLALRSVKYMLTVKTVKKKMEVSVR